MALTADRETARKDGVLIAVPMHKDPQTIYKGSLVMLDANGIAISGADTTGCQFAGVATCSLAVS